MDCSRHTLIGLFGPCPEAKTHFTVLNPKHGFKGMWLQNNMENRQVIVNNIKFKKTVIRFQALGTDTEAFEIHETAADNLQVLKSIWKSLQQHYYRNRRKAVVLQDNHFSCQPAFTFNTYAVCTPVQSKHFEFLTPVIMERSYWVI